VRQERGPNPKLRSPYQAQFSLPVVFASPEALRAVRVEFVEFYNYRRYQKGSGT